MSGGKVTDPKVEIVTLKAAVREFLRVYDATKEARDGAMMIAYVHGCGYSGPDWSKELAALRALVSTEGTE